jgi:hypothetical protein
VSLAATPDLRALNVSLAARSCHKNMIIKKTKKKKPAGRKKLMKKKKRI